MKKVGSIKCSKCDNEIDDSIDQCPYCGESLGEKHDVQDNGNALIKCEECGNDIPSSSSICPICGFPLKDDNSKSRMISDNQEQKGVVASSTKSIIGIIMCLLAVICLIVAVTRITNDEYKFYLQHYQDCLDGYNDVKSTAASYKYGYFKSSYERLADGYEDLMKADKTRIWTFRGEAIALGCAGAVLLILGGRKIKATKENTYGPDTMS